MNVDRSALATVALEVARQAGEHARTGFQRAEHVSEKGRFDLVTEWDVATERSIREALAARTPEIPVVGEEEGGASAAELVWYADPIDGTTNYVHGLPFWCVSIGLMASGQPLLGAVVAPSLAWEWWGSVGIGAFKNGAPCRVSASDDLEKTLLATGFPRSGETDPEDNFSSFIGVQRACQGIRRCGSAAIDLCLVADGTFDGYWERRLNAWDLTAGAALVLAAGGRISDLDGGPAKPTSGRLAATNGKIHDALLALIKV